MKQLIVLPLRVLFFAGVVAWLALLLSPVVLTVLTVLDAKDIYETGLYTGFKDLLNQILNPLGLEFGRN